MSNVELNNTNLKYLNSDYLYHLNIQVNIEDTSDIVRQFGDVRVVSVGGTAKRMRELAIYLRPLLGVEETVEPIDLSASGQRYAMYKVGPVLCVSHGVGSSSFSVVLHELLKLVMYAQCNDPVFIRIGTCGGLGVDPGTVIITKDAYNGYLSNTHEIAILGERVVRPASFPADIGQAILEAGKQPAVNFDIIIANTMSTECFYEGQGRTDGAVCEYTNDDKMVFLNRCHSLGIRNIEMEVTMFSSLTQKAGVKAATICVALINRLKGDQISITLQQKHEFEQRPFLVLGRYIKKLLDV